MYGLLLLMFFTFRVLKDLQDWKEAPLDSLVLSLYQLQAFYLNETKQGLAGLGNYTVAPKYQAACLDHQVAVQYLPTNYPEDIVKRIGEGERNGEIPQVKVKKEGEDQAASGESDKNSDCSCSSTISSPE